MNNRIDFRFPGKGNLKLAPSILGLITSEMPIITLVLYAYIVQTDIGFGGEDEVLESAGESNTKGLTKKITHSKSYRFK